MIFQILTRLGFDDSLVAWPHWSAEFPRVEPKQLDLPQELGGRLSSLVASLLSLDPLKRPRVNDVLRAMPEVILPGCHHWTEKFRGVRGDFQILVGSCPIEVLEWLQQDPDTASLEAASWPPESLQTEEYEKQVVKHEFFGKCCPDAPDVLNTVKIKRALLPERLRKWVAAFKALNQPFFNRFDDELGRRLGRHEDANAQHLCRQPSVDWGLCFGSVQKMDALQRKDRRHVDGGAGVLHLSITLHGHRALHWETASGEKARAKNINGKSSWGLGEAFALTFPLSTLLQLLECF